MVLHVQSWFKLNIEDEKKRGTLVHTTAQGKTPDGPLALGPMELLVGVEREGPNANPERVGWLQLKADDEIMAKIRAWILQCNDFRSADVVLEEGEVLVSVRDEACSHTSHGLHCGCH